MSNVINLDKKRSKNKSNPRQEESLLTRPAPNPETKFNGAFSIFANCSRVQRRLGSLESKKTNFVKYCAGAVGKYLPCLS